MWMRSRVSVNCARTASQVSSVAGVVSSGSASARGGGKRVASALAPSVRPVRTRKSLRFMFHLLPRMKTNLTTKIAITTCQIKS